MEELLAELRAFENESVDDSSEMTELFETPIIATLDAPAVVESKPIEVKYDPNEPYNFNSEDEVIPKPLLAHSQDLVGLMSGQYGYATYNFFAKHTSYPHRYIRHRDDKVLVKYTGSGFIVLTNTLQRRSYLSFDSSERLYLISDQNAARQLFEEESKERDFLDSGSRDRAIIASSKNKHVIQECINVLKDFHSEENFDIIDVSKVPNTQFINWFTRNWNDLQYLIMIKYPEINITNRDFHITKKFHKLTDLYCIIPIDKNLYAKSLMGYRGSLTDDEIATGYRHSHLHTRGRDNLPDHFCVGGQGNPIHDAIVALQHEQLNAKTLFNVLLHLDSHAAYESIEGTPYIQFSNIKSAGTDVVNYSSIYSSVTGYEQEILKKIPNVKFKIDNRKIVVHDEAYDEIEKVLFAQYPQFNCFERDGQYLVPNGSNNTSQTISNSLAVYFKGKEIPFYVTNSDLKKEDIKLHVHPKFKADVIQLINEKIKGLLINI